MTHLPYVFLYFFYTGTFNLNSEIESLMTTLSGGTMGNHGGTQDVVMISRHRVFSKEEASALLPIVRKITAQYAVRVDALLQRLESTDLQNMALINRLENEANDLINLWHSKIEKLGARPKGLWYADFDFGKGCYCWKYPETDLFYWHSYEDGFTGRKLVDQTQAPQVQRENHGKEKDDFHWAEDCFSSD